MSALQMNFYGERGQLLASVTVPTRSTYTCDLPPGVTQMTAVFPEAPLMPPAPAREDSPEFRAHVLRWLREECGITDATEVVRVSGDGTDWEGDTEGGFYPDEDIDIKWRDAAGKEHYREVRGSDFASLWSWVVNSWPVPEEARAGE